MKDRFKVTALGYAMGPSHRAKSARTPDRPTLPVARPRTFDAVQAVEAILYIASKLRAPTLHEVLKICYFADKKHLSEYGSTATGDDYVAMEWGPVASETYNLLKAGRGDMERQIKADYLALVAGAFDVVEKKRVVSKTPPRTDLISESAREAFDWAIEEYGDIDFGDRTAESHDPAWHNAWFSPARGDTKAMRMPLLSIARSLANGSEVVEYLQV